MQKINANINIFTFILQPLPFYMQNDIVDIRDQTLPSDASSYCQN